MAFGASLQRVWPELEFQKYVSDIRHAFDFYVPSLNLLIEFDGEYWHGRYPSKHKDPARLEAQWKNQWFFKCQQAGILTIRVWEKDAARFIEELERAKNENNIEGFVSQKLWSPRCL